VPSTTPPPQTGVVGLHNLGNTYASLATLDPSLHYFVLLLVHLHPARLLAALIFLLGVS
jgi:hypothetical protein